jgi:hypothetical protein
MLPDSKRIFFARISPRLALGKHLRPPAQPDVRVRFRGGGETGTPTILGRKTMFTRRRFLTSTATTGAMLAAGSLAAPALAQGAKIRLGYVSPQTGPLAAFAESDSYNIEAFLASEAGANFEVIVKDSQSNPNRAAEVAKELIVDDEIDLMIVASTPETTNPVSTTCEGEGVPVISTIAPWQPWFIGQQGNPGDPASWKPFDFAFHYFWGLEDVIAVFTSMWGRECLGQPRSGRRSGLRRRGLRADRSRPLPEPDR